MRIANAGGQLVFSKLGGVGIELPDVSLGIGREPDVAVLVFDEAMRAGSRRRGMKFLDLPSLGVHASQYIGVLTAVPDIPIVCREGIVGARTDRWHFPFFECHFHRAGNNYSRRHISLRKILREIVRD